MGNSETERTTVTTYVPAYQAEIWAEHAKDLDMSRSEFVRTMVQAGRRGFDPGGEMQSEHTEAAGQQGFESRIEHALAESGPLSWDGLVETLTENTEDRLDEALLALQEENRVSYSGRAGGYTLNGDPE